MKISEKFCLQWNEFQKNLTTSIKDFREDFCDVTLVSEGHTKIEAHKVILSASSNFFRDILRHNPHSNPLLYMRGIKNDQLAAVLEFIYHGQTSVDSEDLNDFLKVAEELQLRGLSGTEEPTTYMDKDLENIQTVEPSKKSNIIEIPFSPKLEDNVERISEHNIDDVMDKTVVEDTINVVENRYLAEYKDVVGYCRISTTDGQLAETIKSMMDKTDDIWRCTQCGKTNKDKSNLRRHIEAKHIEGVSHSCAQCGKQFRSKGTLYYHNSIHHINIPCTANLEYNPEHKVNNETDVDEQMALIEHRNLVANGDFQEKRISTTDEQLGETIKSMMLKIDGVWTCTQCGKTNNDLSNLRKHIEAKHIDGVSHSCDQCEKQFRSKGALYNHNSIHNKQD